MKKTVSVCLILMVWVFASFSTSSAQSDDGSDIGDISGLVFSDFYWMASHHNDNVEGNNGFWIRRVYLTYDRELSDAFSTRFRLEGSSSGDFFTDPKITPVVKDLYLKWENDRHEILAGISSTPTWGLVEDVWGYRSVEKTPLDLVDFGSSRDFGISVKGQLNDTGDLNYHFMFGNGNSNRAEDNFGKKAMLAVSYALTEEVVVELYGDWNDNQDNTDWLTFQTFIAYRTDALNAGLLYAHQKRNNAALLPGNDLNLDLVSVFARYALDENIVGFFRLDHAFDPIPGVDDSDYLPISGLTEPTILIAGIDYSIESNVHLMPNLEAVFYANDDLGFNPGTDLIPRLTLYYRF